MIRKHFLIILGLVVLISQDTAAQCENANLESGSTVNWMGFTGNCCGINTPIPGIVPGRHTITTPGFDPVLAGCDQISTVYPGGNYSIQLGNSNIGAEAERITFDFSITPTSNLIIYRYAVVLEDPGHESYEQPRFEAQLRTSNGQPIPCTFYQVVASAQIDGFQNCGGVIYKNWTTVGVDASAYMGQVVTLDLATGDCAAGGHFGYAYVEASCAPLEIEAKFCLNSENLVAYLEAPEGFASYLWSTGESSPNITVFNSVEGSVYTCLVTSVTGCQALLSATLEPTTLEADYTVQTNCTGQTLLTSSSVFQNSELDSLHWSSGDGFQSDSLNFVHQFQEPGIYPIELWVQSDAGCVDSIQYEIEVFESPIAEFTPVNICQYGTVDLLSSSYISTNDVVNTTWNIQDSLLAGLSVQYTFDTPGTIPVELVVEALNGCFDSVTEDIIIRPNPIALAVTNSICEGDLLTLSNLSSNYNLGSQFEWSIPNLSVNSNLFELQFPGLEAGIYDFSLSVLSTYEDLTCTDSFESNFQVHGIPEFNIEGDFILCENDLTSIQNLPTVFPAEGCSSFWTFQGQTSSQDSFSQTIADSGFYNLAVNIITDFGCSRDTTLEIAVYPIPEITISPGDFGHCVPFSEELSYTTTSFWGSLLNQSWVLESPNLGVLENGLYTTEIPGNNVISVNLLVGDEFQQCAATNQINATGWPNPVSTFTINPSVIPEDAPIVELINQSAGATSFLWFNDNSFIGDSEDLTWTFDYFQPAVYEICLEVENQFGCLDTSCRTVSVYKVIQIRVPNAFSPNGDGINDDFYPVFENGELVKEYELKIFNRWGKVIFQTDHIDNHWVGNYDNGEYYSPDGVYTWEINFVGKNNEVNNIVGHLVLMR